MNKISMFEQIEFYRNEYNERKSRNIEEEKISLYRLIAVYNVLRAAGLENEYNEWRNNK